MEIGDRRTDSSALAKALPFFAALTLFGVVAGSASGQEYPLPPPGPPPPAGTFPQLSPPPLVRIVGRTTNRGARITRLSVRTPVNSAIVSRCVAKKSKKQCPYSQRVSPVTGVVGTRTIHINGFERSFRAGVVLQLYVVRAGRTGKYTSFTIRLRKTPLRRDRCVSGLTLIPVGCPDA